jgi:cytochrome c peroxidase
MKTYLFISFLVVLVSCSRDPKESLMQVPIPAKVNYQFEPPAHFPKPVYDFMGNPVTAKGFELGRMLFYDPVLSRDSTVSCSSCHQQFVAFAHSDHARSHGIDNQLTFRNSIAIFNLAWQKEYFWDGGVNHLELIPLAPIANPLEMDEVASRAVHKLNISPRYSKLFKEAFGKDSIDSQQMLFALAQFSGLMISSNSKYDQFVTNKATLNKPELDGLTIFTQKCSGCHSGVFQTDNSYRNNGLNRTFMSDTGRERITTLKSDIGKFKVPSLRNVVLTSPYMHDGRISTLDQVLEHYNSGMYKSLTLDSTFYRPDGTYGISLSDSEKQNILAFLQTLTDNTFINDTRFSDPFQTSSSNISNHSHP